MRPRLIFLLIAMGGLALTGAAHAQSIPVKVVYFSETTNDEIGLRVKTALENQIELTSRFSLFDGVPFDIPKNGLVIEIVSLSINLKSGEGLGSAVTLIAKTPSAKERGYFKELADQSILFVKEGSVTEQVASFLAAASKSLK